MIDKIHSVEGDVKVKTLLMLAGLFGLVFGLAYLFIPAVLLKFFGVELTDSTIMTARFFGGAVLGYGVLAWSARNSEDSATRRAIKLAIFVTTLIALVLSVISVVTKFFNAMGWIPVILFLLIAAAFGYVRFVKPAAE
jgi:nicotinamide riboside transporter PnuC